MLPTTMPAIGMMPGPLNGTTPEAKISARTGTIPLAMARPTHGICARGVLSRPVEVTVATTNISSTKARESQTLARAAVITSETRDSCTTARRAAVG